MEKVEEELQKFWDDSRFWQNMAEGKMDNLSDEVQILKRDLSTGNFYGTPLINMTTSPMLLASV